MNASETVRTAFLATKAAAPEYVAKTILQRAELDADGKSNTAAAGSIYWGLKPADIEQEISSRHRIWEEVTDHPAITPGTRVFKTEMSGESGMLSLAELPATTPVLLASPAKGGNLFPLLPAEGSRTASSVTHAIIGVNDPKKPVFITFHPGDLVPRSEVTPESVPANARLVDAQKARSMGFTHAKAVSQRNWLIELRLRFTEPSEADAVREKAQNMHLWWVEVHPTAFDYKIGNTGSLSGYMLAESEEYIRHQAPYGAGEFADLIGYNQFDPRGGEVSMRKVA